MYRDEKFDVKNFNICCFKKLVGENLSMKLMKEENVVGKIFCFIY